jgi:two-component system nitrogen regulation sensor histidine kinase NtrY
MKNFKISLIIRVILITFSLYLSIYVFSFTDLSVTFLVLIAITLIQVYSLIKYIDATNKELTRFLLTIKHSDFSQSFSHQGFGGSFKDLSAAFNEVIESFQKTRGEKEEHLKYLQTVMQHVGVGLISYSENGKVEFINKAAKKLLNINYLQTIYKLDELSEGFYKKIAKLRPGNNITIKIVGENEIIQLLIYTTEFKMREQKYTLVALQNIQSELEDNEMEAWQKLIRVLTHEIMNSIAPISSLAGTVNNMISNGALNNEDGLDDIKNAIATIQKRSDGLINFVQNYRNLTKVPKPNFGIVRIAEIFNRVENLMLQQFEENDISLSFSVEPDTLEITADQELIEQVLINILLNAKHALKNSKEAQVVIISYTDERGKIVIRIIDNGPGISKEAQEKIFIPFFTTKQDGSGIGLSLSRQIMRSHGGNIRVNSVVDDGTVFTLSF